MRQWEFFVQRTNDQRANPNLSEQSHSLHSPQVARIRKGKGALAGFERGMHEP